MTIEKEKYKFKVNGNNFKYSKRSKEGITFFILELLICKSKPRETHS